MKTAMQQKDLAVKGIKKTAYHEQLSGLHPQQSSPRRREGVELVIDFKNLATPS